MAGCARWQSSGDACRAPRTFGLPLRLLVWRPRAPGLEREHLHDGLRHVSASRGRSVVGIGGMAGAIGGMLIASTVGLILQYTGFIFQSS